MASSCLRTALGPALVALVAPWFLPPLCGQDQPWGRDPAAEMRAAAALVDEWTASDQVDEELRGRAVAAVLAAGDPGLDWFGAALRQVADPTSARAKGLRSLATGTCIAFMRQQVDSEMVFAGQYAPLRRLDPFSSRLFLEFLLATPDWYPSTHRKHAVRVLRDLLLAPPDAEVLSALEAIADAEASEPEDLRIAVAHALHQWGRPRHAKDELARWRRQSGEGDTEDRVQALRRLVEIHYDLRDYRAAAAAATSLEVMARHANVDLRPADHYLAACCHALNGDRERAFTALERCAVLQGSGTVDPSLWLARKLFERDPELATLRGSERFERALRTAFPGPAAGEPPSKGR